MSNADAVMYVIDCTDKTSLEAIDYWMDKIKKCNQGKCPPG